MTKKKSRPVQRDEAFQAPAPKPRPKSDKTNEAYGLEGSNKTVHHPGPDDAKPDELTNLTRSRFIPNTPYTRG